MKTSDFLVLCKKNAIYNKAVNVLLVFDFSISYQILSCFSAIVISHLRRFLCYCCYAIQVNNLFLLWPLRTFIVVYYTRINKPLHVYSKCNRIFTKVIIKWTVG